jgi:hypothetical protein
MDAFAEAYAAWRQRPFPPGSANEAIDELHADLALADSWVADSVIPYAENRVHKPAQVDVLAELTRFRERADQLALAANGDDAQLALAYRDYIDSLSKVYGRFLALGAKT